MAVMERESSTYTKKGHLFPSKKMQITHFSCHHCKKVFKRYSLLKSHITINHLKRSCNYKTEVFTSSVNGPLEPAPPENTEKTRDCSFTLPYKPNELTFNSHTIERPCHCTVCDSKTMSHTDFENDVSEKSKNEKGQQSTLCSYRCDQKNVLKIHETQYKCNGNNCRTLLQGSLLTERSGTDQKPYECTLCDYKSKQFHYLRMHVLIKHTYKRPYQCPFCYYTSAKLKNLKPHMLENHKNKKINRSATFSTIWPSTIM